MDPYVYPGTNVLINKLDIRDSDTLMQIEGRFFALRSLENLPEGHCDYAHLKAIHYHYFNDLYDWAGQERTVDIAKDDSYFARTSHISKELNKLFSQLQTENYLHQCARNIFCQRLSYYFNEINAAHPFREGNGRTQRAFCDLLSKRAGYSLDWTVVSKEEYMHASIVGFLQGNYEAMETVFQKITSIEQIQEMRIGNVLLSQETVKHLQDYLEKQLNLTELVHKKNQFLTDNLNKSKNFSPEALLLNQKLKNTAKELVNKKDIQTLLKQPQLISLQQQGGFEKIHTRFKNKETTEHDILAILRHAQSSVISISQLISQEEKLDRKR